MDAQFLVIGVLAGIVGTYIVYKFRIMPEEHSRLYFKGWVDRHQAKPLLPRYWRHGRYLNYHDPIEQQQLKVLWERPGGTVEERLKRGIPPYYTHSRIEYAISKSELEILKDSVEREWRGLDDSNNITRHPWSPSVKDIPTLLAAKVGIDAIEDYYQVMNLQFLKNRSGRFVKLEWDNRRNVIE